MKRPSFQFYPGDWRKDVELRSCSIAARGLWIDLMCVAHECEPYGHLALNGRPMTHAQIAGQIGIPAAQIKKLMDELIANGVARVTDDGTVYSKRMTDDERLRSARAEGGKAGSEHGIKGASHGVKGGRPSAVKGGADDAGKGGFETPLETCTKPPPSSSSSSSSSTPAQEQKPVDSEPGIAAAKSPRPSRKAPASFLVDAELQQWARQNAPGVDIRAETAKLRDHTFKTPITDWPGAWRNWMRRAAEGPPAQRSLIPQRQPALTADDTF